MRRSACLVVGPVAVGGFAALFSCMPVGRASGSMMAPNLGLFILVGWDRGFRVLLAPPGLDL